MAFYELVLVVCLSSGPDTCRERRLTVEAETLVDDCKQLAWRKVETFTAEEPDWRIDSWRCAFPEVHSSLREPDEAYPEAGMARAIEVRETDPAEELEGGTSRIATEDEIFEVDPTAGNVGTTEDPGGDEDPVAGPIVAPIAGNIASDTGLDPGTVAGHADETAIPTP